jgi:hypothetical protein
VPGAALALLCADFNADGWPDIFCSDDGRPNRLFINRGNGTFAEEAVERGLALNAMGATAANMGVAAGDVDEDGLWDLFVTHLSDEYHGLWKQGPAGWFSDRVATFGLQQQAWRGTGFGAVLADFDLDGDLDLVFANGLVRRSLPAQSPTARGTAEFWSQYAQRAQIFMNRDARFVDISEAQPALSGQAMVGRGLAAGDLNGDGRMDLLIMPAGGPLQVYLGANSVNSNWITLRLIDPQLGNRNAIGAEVTVETGQQKWWRLLQPASAYLSNHEPSVHIGLGTADRCHRIVVRWLGGPAEEFPGSIANRSVTLRRGEGKAL